MALNIKDTETDELARELADLRGISITEAVKGALKKSVADERRLRGKASLEELLALARKLHDMPVLDPRSPDEMLYDENGLPK